MEFTLQQCWGFPGTAMVSHNVILEKISEGNALMKCPKEEVLLLLWVDHRVQEIILAGLLEK